MSMPGLTPYRPPTRGGFIMDSNAITLSIRQQPECALLTQENKEKGRKPIDPPPIVQLNVDRTYDPQEQWIVSPYLFMIGAVIEGEEGDTLLPNKHTVGQTSSSLHRLKDIDNKDGGFFVFGDISVRKLGKHRLVFHLFDTDKDTGNVVHLKSITSEIFDVVSNKEFRGLSESTHLSRTFSDQGVRLRLRKEPRALGGHGGSVKRSFSSSEHESPTMQTSTSAYGGPISASASGYGGPVNDPQYGYGSIKRARHETDYTKNEYNNSSAYAQYPDNASSFHATNPSLVSNSNSNHLRTTETQHPTWEKVPHTNYYGTDRGSYPMNAPPMSALSRPFPGVNQTAPSLGLGGNLNAMMYKSNSYFDDGYSPQIQMPSWGGGDWFQGLNSASGPLG